MASSITTCTTAARLSLDCATFYVALWNCVSSCVQELHSGCRKHPCCNRHAGRSPLYAMLTIGAVVNEDGIISLFVKLIGIVRTLFNAFIYTYGLLQIGLIKHALELGRERRVRFHSPYPGICKQKLVTDKLLPLFPYALRWISSIAASTLSRFFTIQILLQQCCTVFNRSSI